MAVLNNQMVYIYIYLFKISILDIHVLKWLYMVIFLKTNGFLIVFFKAFLEL